MSGEVENTDRNAPGAERHGASGHALEIRNLRKRYGEIIAVDGVSLSVPGGVLLSLLGPSGSGKTTLLRLIGGFESPDQGTVEIDGHDVTRLPPHRRNIGIVFQSYALFPHLTVAENVAFPLKQRHVDRTQRNGRVADILEIVGLADYADRKPAEMSGGQQQRVALARALVYQPPLLIMDEPLAALDKSLRLQLQEEIVAIQRRLAITVLYITHDQAEAFAISDLVAVMHAGRMMQVDTPQALYDRPGTEFVARFVGDSNLFRGPVEALADGRRALRLEDGTLLPCKVAATGRESTLLVRPEKILMSAAVAGDAAAGALRGRIVEAKFLGDSTFYRVSAAGREIRVRTPNRSVAPSFDSGTEVLLSWSIDDTIVL